MKSEIKLNFEYRLREAILGIDDDDAVFDVVLEYHDRSIYTLSADIHLQRISDRRIDYDLPPEGGSTFISCESCTIIEMRGDKLIYHDEEAEEIIKNVIFELCQQNKKS